jgi:two-component system CheB/CheR fusion protein
MQRALDALPAAVMVIDTTDTMLVWNPAAEAMFDIPVASAISRKFRDLDVSYRVEGLRARIEDVKARHAPGNMNDVTFSRRNGETVHADISILPLFEAYRLIGILVFAMEASEHARLKEQMGRIAEQHATAIEELQSTNEELETTNEELQSTNEELETTNEELQSTNEELETMNEELQSTNEELETMNDELRSRSDDLNEVNAFLESILGSFHAAVVVVDAELRVQAWNDQASELWGLRIEEVLGQHLLNLDIGLPVAKLRDPIRASVATGTPDELVLEALNRRGRTIACTVTISPLRGAKGDLRGAIILMDDGEEGAQ